MLGIIVKGSGDFSLVDNKIVKTNGSSFFVKKSNGFITLSDFDDSSKSFKDNKIIIDGISISTYGKTLTINGDIDNVVLNGKTLSIDSFIKKDVDDGSVKEFSISENINSISINGSGSFSLDGSESNVLLDNPFIATIAGSGDIYISNYRNTPLILNVVGSGDIRVNNVQGNSLVASVTGSGDISLSRSSFNSVSKNVVGSGDIHGI